MMTASAILALVLQYGPSIIPLIGQLRELAKNGDRELTDADWQVLVNFSKQKADDYIVAAGGTPPPNP